MPFEFEIPSSMPGEPAVNVLADRNVVVVGGNGSGKSRLAAWMDIHSLYRDRVHRVTAQKNLTMPDSVGTLPIAKARSQLLYGATETDTARSSDWKIGHRYGGTPVSHMVNDFSALLCYLFSQFQQASVDYYNASREDQGSSKLSFVPTDLEKVEKIWNEILPHRELILKNQQVFTRIPGSSSEYSGGQMSDGERVIFYLIGQCVAIPAGHIIVIDEPELHIHKSIQVPLWSAIERTRPDCLFVYLTHDVDFAASMAASVKLWLKSYDGSNWSWEFIQEQGGVPESLLLEILGSRKQVLVVEGVKGGKDSSLYQLLFPEYLVIPVGSCSRVVDIVKSLNGAEAGQLHHLNVRGLIDRDRRTDAEIESLVKHKIYVLEVAEVESLFCVEPLLRLVSEQLARDPFSDIVSIKQHVFKRFAKELDKQISLRAASEIKYQLNVFDENLTGEAALAQELKRLAGSIDVAGIYAGVSERFSETIRLEDYRLLLGFYNRKSLADTVAAELGLGKGQLFDLVLRLAKSDKVEDIRVALKPYFGNFKDIEESVG